MRRMAFIISLLTVTAARMETPDPSCSPKTFCCNTQASILVRKAVAQPRTMAIPKPPNLSASDASSSAAVIVTPHKK